MKNIVLIIGLLISFVFVNAQEFIYNSNGTKRFFMKQDSSFMISIHKNKESIEQLKARFINSNHLFFIVTNTKVVFNGKSEVLHDYFNKDDFSYSLWIRRCIYNPFICKFWRVLLLCYYNDCKC